MGWLRLEPRRQGTARKPDRTPDADDSGNAPALYFGVEREARNAQDEGGLVYREDFALGVTALEFHGAI
jgi:hypothetical protein